MSDVGLMDEYIRTGLGEIHERTYQEISKHADAAMNEAAVRNLTTSGPTMGRLVEIYEEGLENLVEASITLEVETRRRFNCRLSDAEAARILRALEGTITRAYEDGGRLHRSLARWGDGGLAMGKRSRDKLATAARRKVRRALMEAKIPQPRHPPSVQNVIEVNAPNYGVIASRIDALDFGIGGDDLKDILRQLLEASREQLPKEQADEASEIVEGLVTEAERTPSVNPSLVRQAFRRLRELAKQANDAETLLKLVSRGCVLFEPLLRALPR